MTPTNTEALAALSYAEAAKLLANELDYKYQRGIDPHDGEWQEAVTLLHSLSAVEAERDALRADFSRLMEKHNNLHVNAARDRAERDALRAERDDLKRALAFTARLVQDWQQSAIAIGAERDAFRANSDRYLWLRDTHGGVQEGDANWPSLVQVCWSRHGPRDEKFPDEKKDGEVIDAAIDAARAAMKGTQ